MQGTTSQQGLQGNSPLCCSQPSLPPRMLALFQHTFLASSGSERSLQPSAPSALAHTFSPLVLSHHTTNFLSLEMQQRPTFFQAFSAPFYRPKGSWFWWETSQLSPPHFGSAHQAFLQQEVTATVLHVSALKCPFQISDSSSFASKISMLGFSSKLYKLASQPSFHGLGCSQAHPATHALNQQCFLHTATNQQLASLRHASSPIEFLQ